MNLVEHQVEIGGRKFYYWLAGNKKKPAVVFLHGFMGNHRGLISLAKFFQDDYLVVMPDFPACGKSESLSQHRHGIKSYAAWLDEFIRAISLKNPVIIGHSFGARVGTYFSAEYPKSAKAVVLITPVVRVEKFWAHVATWVHKLVPGRWQKKYITNSLYQQFIFWLMFKNDDVKTRAEVVSDSLEEAKKVENAVRLEMFNDLYQHDFNELAGKITIPCFLIVGLKDEIVSISSIQSFVDKIKNVQLEIIEHTGHMLPIEHPNYTADIIKSWLKKLG